MDQRTVGMTLVNQLRQVQRTAVIALEAGSIDSKFGLDR